MKESVGYLWPVATLRLCAFIGAYALMGLAARRDVLAKSPFLLALRGMPWQPRARVEGSLRVQLAKPWIIGVALLDTLAWAGVSLGFSMGNNTVVTAISSLSHAMTVFLAWFLLNDRLSKW